MMNKNIILNEYLLTHTKDSVYTETFCYHNDPDIAPHSHEFLEIGITLNGSAEHLFYGKKEFLCPGSVYVIPVRTSHEIRHMNDWEIRNIYLLPTVFSSSFLHMDFAAYHKIQNLLMKYGHNDSNLLQFTLSPETFEAVKTFSMLLDPSLFSDANSYLIYQNHCILNLILLLAEDFSRQYKNSFDYQDPRMLRIHQLISAHLDHPMNLLLKELSSALELNSQYINRIVKKSIGIPISRYIIQCKIEKSIQLLQTSEQSLSAIAHSLGFFDYSHFHKYFTQYTGNSPQVYRKQIPK